MKQFIEKNKKNVWFWTFSIIAIALFFIIPLLSLNSGNTGDEDGFQIPQGKNVLNYYRTGGEDTTCLSFENLKYYGSSFDVITGFFNDFFQIDNINISRHIFNSLFGWLTIFFVGLIGYFIGGWRAGVFSMLLLFLSPRFLGHSFNNPKDIPFAAAITGAIYFMLIFFKQFPKVKWWTFLLLIVSIAFSISIRVGGLILFGYFGLFGLLFLIKIARDKKKELLLSQTNSKYKNAIKLSDFLPSKTIFRLLIYGLIVCLIGYFAGLILWPFALKSPINNTLEAFDAMSKFAISLRQLFEGEMQWSDVLPWYYTPKYILMTIPIAVIIGMLVYPFIGGWKKENRFTTFMIYFAFIFPVFWIVYSNANVYGGWRHAIFAYPPMVVAAGLGFNALIDLVKNKYGKIALTILPFLLLITPLMHIIRNHPYEYVYFNELAGGVKKAYGNYELDYYYHSTREASEWVLANAKKSGLETGKKIKVATWHSASVNYFFRKDTADYQVVFSRWYERGNSDWDYAIFTVTGIMPEQIKSTHFPPSNTVHTINVDGKPICIILKRTDKSDFEGFKLKEAKKTAEAVPYFKKALKVDPYNEAALMNLIECYFLLGFPDSAKTLIDHSLAFLPSYEPANYFNAHYYISKGNPDEALKCCKKIIKDNFKFPAAYYLACNIYVTQRDLNSAEKMLGKLIDIDQIDNQGVQMLIQIYMAQGLNEQGAYKKLYKKMAKSLDKRGKEKEAEEFWDMYHKL